MILVDTSLWIEHLRRSHAGLVACLDRGEVLGHPLVIGELACGSLRDRPGILGLLDHLPSASEATHAEVRTLIERERLMSQGIGIVDLHLLASARLSAAALWTLDRRLADAAKKLRIAHKH